MDSLQAFSQLKALLLLRYQEVYPHIKGDLREFKQKDILNFQLLLEEKVHARVSEKWFYTHLKVEANEKLPRIDTLNLLARFVDYTSWEAFYHSIEKAIPTETKQGSWRKWLWLLLLIPIAWILSMSLVKAPTPEIEICFVDAIRRVAITEQVVQVTVNTSGQPTLQLKSNEQGCLVLPSEPEDASLIINAAYYLPDTLQLSDYEPMDTPIEITLQSDDYALMIHYFSNSKLDDWKRRKAQLETVFADDAIIYQIDPNGQLGMDILNKNEFINKLTIPINSLRNVEVLQTKYEAGQVVELRFRVKR